MISSLIKTLTMLVWLTCMGWMVRFEAYPRWFDNSLLGYQDVVDQLPQLVDNWMRVVADGKHVGYSHSNVDHDQLPEGDRIVMKSIFFLRMKAGDSAENLRMFSNVVLDDRKQLVRFELGGSFGQVKGRMEGHRLEGLEFEVAFFVQGQEVRRGKMEIPADALLSNPVFDSGFQNVKTGETLRIRLQDPLTGQLSEVTVTGMGDERIHLQDSGEAVQARRLQMLSRGLTMNAWLDESGRVLRQQLPFGNLFLEASTSADAVQVKAENALELQDVFGQTDTAPPMLNLMKVFSP